MAQTISERREIFYALRLRKNLDPLNPAVNSYVTQIQPGLLQQTGDPAAAQQNGLVVHGKLTRAAVLGIGLF